MLEERRGFLRRLGTASGVLALGAVAARGSAGEATRIDVKALGAGLVAVPAQAGDPTDLCPVNYCPNEFCMRYCVGGYCQTAHTPDPVPVPPNG